MLIQGKTGLSSGTENGRKRDQLERLWILEGRCSQGQETFVTGLSQGQMRGAAHRPLGYPSPHSIYAVGLSNTLPLSFL